MIVVNPTDFETLGGNVKRLCAEIARSAKAEVIADATVSPGGCRLETQHGVVDRSVGPGPEPAVCLSVGAQEVSGDDRRAADPHGQGPLLHAVLDPEGAQLEQLALEPVRFLGRVRRHGAGLLSEGEIGISGPIGLLHGGVSRQRRGNPELLL